MKLLFVKKVTKPVKEIELNENDFIWLDLNGMELNQIEHSDTL